MTPRQRAAQLADGMFKLLSDPDRWCRGLLAVDVAGNGVDDVSGPDACAWCLLGAETKISCELWPNDEERQAAKAEFYPVLLDLIPHHGMARYGIACFNDDLGTSHSDILMLLRKVADELRKA